MSSTQTTFEFNGTIYQQWAASMQLYPMNQTQQCYTKPAKALEVHINDLTMDYFACLKDQGIETPSKIQAMKAFKRERSEVTPPSTFVYPIFNRTLDISYHLGLCPKTEMSKGQQMNGNKEEQQEESDYKFIQLTGLVDLYLASTFFPPDITTTDNNVQTGLDNIAVCSTNKLSPFCCNNRCECKNSEMQEWMLDSGASFHFSGDINDFVDYTQMEEEIPLRTANSSAIIKGKGTIILMLSTGEKVRIYPVFYVLGLTCKLLSLGMFLQDGFQVIGVIHFIKVIRDSLPFLTFKPRSKRDSIYVIRALAACDADLHSAVQSIYVIDYETMHKQLVHPSKDVLQTTRKHLKYFPQIEIPSEDHVCPGCTQGKMTNCPFPVMTQRASQPFELIHSEVKSFPVESYYRFRYVIIFFDDYSSNAWTVNLHTKDAALTATSQFLAYVELQYGSKVQQWMSNAGGEYKSAAFTKMLKDRGIEILQSIPYVHQQNGGAE